MTEAQQIRIQLLHPEAKVPTYGSEEAAGADLYAVFEGEERTIMPGERLIVDTGVAIELNPGTEAQVRPRSGLAAKHGLTVVNAPGTIDSDYRGEIKVILLNTGDRGIILKKGERIAQMVIAPVIRGVFTIAESLDDTSRGENGFGSTGK
ncbi:dUTP diphosphatase [Ensifer sp. ENS10]|nr:dUTP diphosphatase [Ensifer sp. ENS10]MBD9511540.1 dUTP diphosphatase [Ensifer sp. ENS10]